MNSIMLAVVALAAQSHYARSIVSPPSFHGNNYGYGNTALINPARTYASTSAPNRPGRAYRLSFRVSKANSATTSLTMRVSAPPVGPFLTQTIAATEAYPTYTTHTFNLPAQQNSMAFHFLWNSGGAAILLDDVVITRH